MDDNDSISMLSNDEDEEDDYGDIANKGKLRPSLTTESFLPQTQAQQQQQGPQGPQTQQQGPQGQQYPQYRQQQ